MSRLSTRPSSLAQCILEGLERPATVIGRSPESGRLAESIRAMHACLENERLDVKRWKDVHRWMDSAPRDLRLRAAVRADLERWEHLFGEKSATLGRFVPETAESRPGDDDMAARPRMARGIRSGRRYARSK